MSYISTENLACFNKVCLTHNKQDICNSFSAETFKIKSCALFFWILSEVKLIFKTDASANLTCVLQKMRKLKSQFGDLMLFFASNIGKNTEKQRTTFEVWISLKYCLFLLCLSRTGVNFIDF